MDAALVDLLTYDGRRALVTGAATGIGEGIARMLARAGASVVVGDIDVAGAERVAADIGGTAIELDVRDPASAERAVAAVGGIDVLVNNAGTFLEAGSILDQTHESWHQSVAVNFVGVFNCAKAAAIDMVGGGRRGAIVNISSVDGILPCLGTGYDSAKAAVNHFTRSLAVDLAPHGIRVNAIAPGVVPVPTLDRIHSGELPPLWPPDSSLTGLMGPLMRQRSANVPIGRKGTPDDIAHAVLFLAGPMADYVTGATLVVDGGWTLV